MDNGPHSPTETTVQPIPARRASLRVYLLVNGGLGALLLCTWAGLAVWKVVSDAWTSAQLHDRYVVYDSEITFYPVPLAAILLLLFAAVNVTTFSLHRVSQIMATDDSFDSSMRSKTNIPTHKQHSRLPILVGVLAGMLGWFVLLALFETWLSILIFGQPPGKQVWATPGYYCIHRTLLLLTCTVGGAIGLCFSSMRKRNAFLFLGAVIGIVAIFAALFPR